MTVAARSSRLRDARPIFMFCILLTAAAIVGQTWWAIAQDRALTLEQETTNGVAAVRTIEEHAARTLEDAERAVGAVIDTIRASSTDVISDEIGLRDILIRQRQETVHLQSLRFIDPHGMSAVTTFAYPSPVIDVSDRHYVRTVMASTDPMQTVIGHPIESRYDQAWILPIARGLYDLHDKRIGFISAYISIAYFSDFYERIAKDRHAVVCLQTADGYMIARSPYDPALIGRDISASPVTKRIMDGGVEGSFISEVSAAEPRSSLYTYRRVGNSPVIAVYSRNLDDLLSGWRSRSENRIAFAGITITLIGVLTFLLMTHISRLHRSESRLTASEVRYRALYEGASDGIVLVNRAHEYVHCNPAALRMFGASSTDDFVGMTVDDFSPTQSQQTAHRVDIRARVDAAFTGQPQVFEWSMHQQGLPVCHEVSLSLATIDDTPMLFCVFRDITSRKNAELLQQGQNLILHLIGTDADLPSILQQIVRFIEQAAPHAHCLMLLVADDQSHFTTGIGSAIGNPVIMRMTASPIGENLGGVSEALVTKCPVIIEDLTTDPALDALINGADDRTADPDHTLYRACGSWPIMTKRGQILGIFSLLYKEASMPSGEEMMLVGIGTDLAGIAIEGKIADDTIRHLAHHDELTGLPNRFLYTQHLENALSHGERYQTPVGVLFLDLDRFKFINDSFGHVAGDAVLRQISARFQKCLREIDIIARVGGDEFIVLVDQFVSPHQLGDVAQRLLYEAVQPFEIDGEECQLSVSIGIATYPLDGTDARTLLKNADIAMYRAKSTGKNNYQFYSATMNTHTIDRLALETRIRRAIERREFIVHYQPKIDVATGRIAGAEALVRWMHPERGLLFPGEFIGPAEEAGLIGAIGLQVIEQTCAGIDAFRATGIDFGRIAINLSASQFNETALLDDVLRILATRHIDPSHLEFEITESMVMHNRDDAIGLMDRMRALGFSLSIDDFGTGYSSLAYLKRFPVDSVKVDKSYINYIPDDPNDSAIVQAIIVMAHTLGLKVTAEGVETATQLEILRGFGCDEYQGWYFSKALPEADFMALLQRQIGMIAA
jgi:diguanylate cyclase (GGDEF)-like protein/PAS domain S-box-containing protein